MTTHEIIAAAEAKAQARREKAAFDALPQTVKDNFTNAHTQWETTKRMAGSGPGLRIWLKSHPEPKLSDYKKPMKGPTVVGYESPSAKHPVEADFDNGKPRIDNLCHKTHQVGQGGGGCKKLASAPFFGKKK